MLSPAFLSQGDSNRDSRLSRDEFDALSKKWFEAWDAKKKGKLDAGQIRAGLNSTGKFPEPGGGGGGMGGLAAMLQGPEGKRNGLASAMGIEFVYVHADLEFEGRLLRDVAVRYKGNGTFMESRGSLKRSLKIDLNKYAKGQALGDVTKLTLQNNVTDASWMNEVLSYRLFRDAGVPAPRTTYARVFVTVPGKFDRKYFGLYSLSENVDKQFAERNFGTKRGAIFKPVTPNLFADLGPDWSKYTQTYDPKTDLYDEQKQAVMELCRLVTHAEDAEFAARIGHRIDLHEFARYMAVTVWLSDLDGLLGLGQNVYLHLHPKTHLIQFIPWDQDHSFGQFPRGNQEQRDNMSIHHPSASQGRFLDRMFKVEAFKKLYLARMEEFSKTIFQPDRLARQVDEIAAAIRPAVLEESQSKVARFDKAVAGEILSGGGFGFFGGPGIKTIKPFAVARTKSVSDQIAGTSEGQTVPGFGFPGGGQPPAEMPGGPEGFGIGMIFGGPFAEALDQNKDAAVSREEFALGFAKLFKAWNTNQNGLLTQEQLRAGIDKDLSPFKGGFPRFGPPPGGPGGPGWSPGRPGEGGPPGAPGGFPPPNFDQKTQQ